MDPPSLPLLGSHPSGSYPVNSGGNLETQYPNTSEWTNERQRDRDRNSRSERIGMGRGWGASSSYGYSYQPGRSSFDGYGSNQPNFQYGGGGGSWGGGPNYYDSRDDRRSRSRERVPLWCRDARGEIPDQAIVVRGLPLEISEVNLLKEVTRFGLQPRDVRLIRRESGASSGVAVVEFQSLQDSVRWKEVTQGVLLLQGQRARLTYSLPKEVITLPPNIPGKRQNRASLTPKEEDTPDPIVPGDWFCATCGVSNFQKRDMCFKCNFPREGVPADNSEGSTFPKDSRSSGSELTRTGRPREERLQSCSLLFRNLGSQTTEEEIRAILDGLTTPPIKSLKVARDNATSVSKGFCTAEFHSPAEATEVHTLLKSMGEKFSIEGKQVMVSYARRPRTAMNRLVCKLHNRKERLEGRMKEQDSRKSERSEGESSSQSRERGNSGSDNYASDSSDKVYAGSQDAKEETPNCTIVVRGLMPSVSKADLRKEVTKHGLQPKDVRLLRKKGTGASRGFAFVEFETTAEATQWKELTQGTLLIEGENPATLHYSIPMEVITLERNHASRQNWLCTTCGVSNFRQRIVCFQCNTPRLR